MAKQKRQATGRRKFLKRMAAGAATLASAPQAGTAQQVSVENHQHQTVPSDAALRVKALESLLVEKGLVDPAALDALVDTYEHAVGPRHGARGVARAWVDADYKRRLLADGTAAIAELGFSGQQGEKLTVVENTASIHN